MIPDAYVTVGEYTLDEVLPFRVPEKTRESRREYAGYDGTIYNVQMGSSRFHLFARDNKCVVCGLEGSKMLLQYSINSSPDHQKYPHFNMYGEEFGQLILFTKDHIRPASRGGANDQKNYQTMCAICNNLKQHYPLTLEQLRDARKIWNEDGMIAARLYVESMVTKTSFDVLVQSRANKYVKTITEFYPDYVQWRKMTGKGLHVRHEQLYRHFVNAELNLNRKKMLDKLADLADECHRAHYLLMDEIAAAAVV